MILTTSHVALHIVGIHVHDCEKIKRQTRSGCLTVCSDGMTSTDTFAMHLDVTRHVGHFLEKSRCKCCSHRKQLQLLLYACTAARAPCLCSVILLMVYDEAQPSYAAALAGSLASGSHSHSIVPGGFDVMSYTTRFTPRTPLQMRDATSCRNFGSKGYLHMNTTLCNPDQECLLMQPMEKPCSAQRICTDTVQCNSGRRE